MAALEQRIVSEFERRLFDRHPTGGYGIGDPQAAHQREQKPGEIVLVRLAARDPRYGKHAGADNGVERGEHRRAPELAISKAHFDMDRQIGVEEIAGADEMQADLRQESRKQGKRRATPMYMRTPTISRAVGEA